MTRPIYFRAWSPSKQKMYGPFRIDMYFKPSQAGYKDAVDQDYDLEPADDLIWMQRTDLKDGPYSGRDDIYEHDILRAPAVRTKDGKTYYHYFEVVWVAGRQGTYPRFELRDVNDGYEMLSYAATFTKGIRDLKKVGNRYQNPDLLDCEDSFSSVMDTKETEL